MEIDFDKAKEGLNEIEAELSKENYRAAKKLIGNFISILMQLEEKVEYIMKRSK